MPANEHAWGNNWQASPLVDTSTPSQPQETGSAQAETSGAPKQDPNVELLLKPAVPFIQAIEARLSLPSVGHKPTTGRLNQLQTLLFGEALYTDAGELIQKLTTLFPAEAEKNNVALQQLFQPQPPPNQPVMTTQPQIGTQQQALQGDIPQVSSVPTTLTNSTLPSSNLPSSLQKLQQRARQIQAEPFDSDSNWDDNWGNEQESAPRQQGRVRQPRGASTVEGVKTLGRGLASLAMVAAPIAANYFLNKGNGNSITDSLGLTPDPSQYSNYPYVPYGYNGYNSYQPLWNGQQYINPNGSVLSPQQLTQLRNTQYGNPLAAQRLWGNTRIVPRTQYYNPYSAYGTGVYQQNSLIPGWGY